MARAEAEAEQGLRPSELDLELDLGLRLSELEAAYQAYSEALKALVLLAQRNSAALRNLSCGEIDQSVISILDRVQRTLSASFDTAASSEHLPTPARELPASSVPSSRGGSFTGIFSGSSIIYSPATFQKS